jgi:hypothetical protein
VCECPASGLQATSRPSSCLWTRVQCAEEFDIYKQMFLEPRKNVLIQIPCRRQTSSVRSSSSSGAIHRIVSDWLRSWKATSWLKHPERTLGLLRQVPSSRHEQGEFFVASYYYYCYYYTILSFVCSDVLDRPFVLQVGTISFLFPRNIFTSIASQVPI